MDRIIRATAGDGAIKMAVINARDTVERARQIHGCAPTACAALGRTLCAASLMGQDMKEENAALTIRINGNGPLGGIVAVSDCEGNVRGYVGNPATELPLRSDGKLNVGAAVGRDGMFTVSRDIGLREPYIGSVELVSGEIAEDLTAYLLESEQVPSACALGVLVDTDCTVKAAGGFIVQLMDGATDETAALLEERIASLPSVTTMLSEGETPESILERIWGDMDLQILEDGPVAFRCDCTRERTLKLLSLVSADELQDMVDEGEDVEMVCAFCNSKYQYSPDEIAALIEE